MLVRLFIALIHLYQATLSRVIGRVCRFEPSCSQYTAACLESHGLWRGALLSVRRVCKCHPFHRGGHDPPPPRAPTTRPSGLAQANQPASH